MKKLFLSGLYVDFHIIAENMNDYHVYVWLIVNDDNQEISFLFSVNSLIA